MDQPTPNQVLLWFRLGLAIQVRTEGPHGWITISPGTIYAAYTEHLAHMVRTSTPEYFHRVQYRLKPP